MKAAPMSSDSPQGEHELYREVILDHARNPRNFGALENATRTVDGINPLCGDRLTLYVDIDDERLDAVRFDGHGCAISLASASLLTVAVEGRSIEDALELRDNVLRLLEQGIDNLSLAATQHSSLAALAGVRGFPSRIKCATLVWQALGKALERRDAGPAPTVTTE